VFDNFTIQKTNFSEHYVKFVIILVIYYYKLLLLMAKKAIKIFKGVQYFSCVFEFIIIWLMAFKFECTTINYCGTLPGLQHVSEKIFCETNTRASCS
jgi:hypothetical protein